jgi:hypothetical protein
MTNPYLHSVGNELDQHLYSHGVFECEPREPGAGTSSG